MVLFIVYYHLSYLIIIYTKLHIYYPPLDIKKKQLLIYKIIDIN